MLAVRARQRYLLPQCTSSACGSSKIFKRSAQTAVGPVPTASKRNRTDTSTIRGLDVVRRVANQQGLLGPRPGARQRGMHDVRIGLRRGRIVFCVARDGIRSSTPAC